MNQESRIKNIRKKVKYIIHNSLFMIHPKGFTLIELLVAISIIGILASFLLANFVGVRQRARDGVRKSDLRQIQSALELYRSDKGSYPTTLPACANSFTDGANPPVIYMRKIPCDPSGALVPAYAYTSPAGNTTYSLVTCLENKNDAQRDATNVFPCDGTTNFSYTLQNP